MSERTPVTDPGEIWLDGRPYKVMDNSLDVEYANIFTRRVAQGDPGPDDHPTFTTSTQRDWSGGGLVLELNPASDTGRYWTSDCETQYPGTLALPPLTTVYPSPGAEEETPIPLGDFNDRLHVAWGDRIYTYDVISDQFDFQSNTDAPVTSQGTPYREFSDQSDYDLLMFIPLSNGYATINTEGETQPGTGTMPVIDFEVWDNKLFRLLADGSVWYCTYRPVAEGDWQYVTMVSDGSRPRVLTSYMDKQSNPTLTVVTDGATFKLDFSNGLLHKDDLSFPRHPHQGRAATNHKGELFVSVGTGIHRFDNNTISAMGLDSRDGMPPEYRGFVKDLETAYNGLWALVQGERLIPLADQTDDYQLALGGGDDQIYFANTQTNNLLMLHNGFGWHRMWRGAGSPPTFISVSNAQNTYSIWWGANGRLFTQQLERTYFNPGNADTRGHYYAREAEHISSWNDWGWIDQDKILKQVELKTTKMTEGCRIQAYYRLDDEDAPWVQLATITENGRWRYQVGQHPREQYLRGGAGHFYGVRHRRIQLRFLFERGDNPSDSPVIEWHTVIVRRWLRPQRFWRMRLDMAKKVKDHSIQAQRDHLLDLSLRQQAVVFEHQDRQFMAELILLQGPQGTGKEQSSVASITLMEAIDLDHPDDRGTSNAFAIPETSS